MAAPAELWHRTLVYFGMADEDDDYDDDFDEDEDEEGDEPDRGRGRRSSAEDELERSYRERPSVRRLGSRRRESEFDDIFADESAPARKRPVRVAESRSRPAEVHLVVPKNFNDAQQIADRFKVGVPVILNLQSADSDLAKRLIDFSSGLTYALDGGMQRVADKVFMLTPRDVEVSAEEKARLLEKGFFNQY